MNDIAFNDNPAAHRFELTCGGSVAAYVQYDVQHDTITLTHTEVLPAHEGQGLGSKAAKFALDTARSRGLAVVPQCEFIAGYIRKHAEYRELVAPGHRAALDS